METHTAPVPSGRRAAASWVAGTGAFLMLAAAALFVAVNWDRIPPSGKLAIVVGLTGACLGIGARLRSSLPATGDVLVHLGALLVTVDVAAVGLHQGFTFDEVLLAEGVVCSVVYLALGEAFRSVVLRWAADAAVVVAAVGLDATTDVPAGVPLAMAAAAGLLAGRDRSATVWSVAAGMVLLTGAVDGWTAVGVGLVAAMVLGRQAETGEDERLAFSAVAVFVVGVLSALFTTDVPSGYLIVGAGAAFLVVELVAMALSADPFWGRPARVVGGLAEVAAGVVTLPMSLGLMALAAANLDAVSNAWALALAVAGVGWLAADVRRGDPFSTFTIFSALSIAGAGVWVSPAFTVACGLVGVALLVVAARRHADEEITPVYTVTAVGVLLGSVFGGHSFLHDGGVVVTLLIALWAIANLVDENAANLPRAVMAIPLVASVFVLPAEGTIAVGLLTAVLFAIDAVRHDTPAFGIGSAVAAQVVVGSMAIDAGLSLPAVGVSLAVAALVWAGLAAVVEEYWRLPFVAAAAIGVAIGFVLALDDPRSTADVLIVAGALLIGLGVARPSTDAGHGGGLVVILGVFGHLGATGVSAPEAYALPVALHLLVAGFLARRQHPAVSSWWAYAPATLVLGGVAFAERIGGGPSWHALVAGGVGVLAVSFGGWHRLAGPLFSGTALLTAVAVYESLGTLATAPTWAWLAAGGTTLLCVGILLERSDRTPAEVGRRLVDVVQDRFS